MKSSKYLILAVSFFITLYSSLSLAQVNTENMRTIIKTHGFYNDIQINFGLNSGNTDFYNLKGNYRADYITSGHYSFGIIQYQRGFQGDDLFLNKGFIHLRHVHKLTRELFKWELFAQKEFNDFLLLLDRNLLGGGLRSLIIWMETGKKDSKSHRLIQMYLGNGIMWEHEKLDLSPVSETKIYRSTNYVTFNWKFEDRINLSIISYVQFNLERFKDHRLLMNSSIGFNITKSLIFRTTFNLRYDSEPPADLEKHDLELTNGFQFLF